MQNRESQLRQYRLADYARDLGFNEVETIDEDLGRSGSGLTERPGFQRLVTEVCPGQVGAVFCLEASRLARNGRDWHHLIELCGLIGAMLIDPEGMYDPRLSNDRLLLGLRGTMSEYELSVLRQRSLEFGSPKTRPDLPPPAVDKDAPSGKTFRWNLSRQYDLHGTRNLAVYVWAQSPTRQYLRHLYYTPPAQNLATAALDSFAYHVELSWENPGVIQQPYTYADRQRHFFRLRRVAAAAAPWSGAGGRQLVRAYHLDYYPDRSVPGAQCWAGQGPQDSRLSSSIRRPYLTPLVPRR